MAHEIDQSNGQDNMAWVGDRPWHGLGQELEPGAGFEIWRKAAGMDWEVNTTPALFKDKDGEVHAFDERQIMYRSDTKVGLGFASLRYKPVHPGEVLEFFQDLIADHGFTLETAGCLFGGRKYWALARIGESFGLQKRDKIDPFVLMATACDGSMSTVVHPTSIRVVCNNTLRFCIGGNGQMADIRVPHHAQFVPDKVRAQLGELHEHWAIFKEDVHKLSSIQIDRETGIYVVSTNLKPEAKWVDPDTGDILDMHQRLEASPTLSNIINLFEGAGKGSTLPGSKGTGWGLVNAVTEHFDHHTGGNNGEMSRAFERAHLTDRATFKTKIADMLLAA